MANLRLRTHANQECGGLGLLGLPGSLSVSPVYDWRDVGDSGSIDYTIKFANCINGASYQWFSIYVRTTWSISRDRNNRITVSGTNAITGINISGTTPWSGNWIVRFRDAGSGAQIGSDFVYTGYSQGNWGWWGQQSFSYTINPGATSPIPQIRVSNWAAAYANEWDCNKYVDKGVAGPQFRNNMAWIWDDPSISSVSCVADGGGAKLTYNGNYGATIPSGTNVTKVDISRNSGFTDIVYTASNNAARHTFTIGEGALASNTKYYVRYTMTNSAGKVAQQFCEFITLTRNTLTNPVSVRYDREMIDLTVLYGGRIYRPDTTVYYRKCGTSAWTEGPNSDTTSVKSILLTGLEAETCYEAQARTTTTAGTYNGPILRFTTAEKDKVTGVITSVDTYIDDDDFETHAKVCFKVMGNCTPITAHLEYRIKNGLTDEWMTTPDKEYPDEENDDCVIIDELIPNQTIYEVRVKAKCGQNEGTGEISEFTTPLLDSPTNYNCENYQYMVDMICQVMRAISKGMKTLYANEDAKQLCDPYSENPTFAAMWSRVLRFYHGAICAMCEMTDTVLKSGLPGQVYMGQVGWQDMSDLMAENDELVSTSNSVAVAVEDAMTQVWHFDGVFTYLVATYNDLANLTDAEDGDTAIVADETNPDDDIAYYTYDGSAWSHTAYHEALHDFSVVQLEKGSQTAIGRVKPAESWYVFKGHWSHLNADTTEVEERIEALENQVFVYKQSDNEDDIRVQYNYENFDYTTLPDGERTICFVVERPDRSITAAEYDALNITAQAYDDLNISADDYDYSAKEILT